MKSFREGSLCRCSALVFFLTRSPMKDFTAPCLIFLFTVTPPQCADRASTALGCKSFGPRQTIHERLWQQIATTYPKRRRRFALPAHSKSGSRAWQPLGAGSLRFRDLFDDRGSALRLAKSRGHV